MAKSLPCLQICEKEKLCKELVEDNTSLIIWPKEECSKFFCRIALMMVSESPSKIEVWNPSSLTNWTARHATKVSKTSTESGMRILFARAANNSPLSSRTTTPILAELISSNTASSKFVLTLPWSGGFQRGLWAWIFLLRGRSSFVEFC